MPTDDTTGLADGFAVAGQPIEEDDEADVAAFSAQLEALLIQPSYRETVMQIFDRHLSRGIVPATMDSLRSALTALTDEDFTDSFIVLLLRARAEPDYRADLENRSDPEIGQFLQVLLAVYGEALQETYECMRKNPNAWKQATREVYWEIVAGEWRVSFDVTTYSNERHHFEESPTSLLYLAEAIVDTLNALPPETAPEAIDATRLASFQTACSQLNSLAAPERNVVALDGTASVPALARDDRTPTS